MERGFVKLYRSIDQNELLENDNTAFIVFLKLLLRVDRRTGTYTTGRKKLANMCNLNPNTLYSALKRLEASTIIQQQSNTTSTTISICNWWKYQQDDNKTSNVRQSAVNTKQEKKEKENKKEINKEKSLTTSNAYDHLMAFWNEQGGRKLQDNKSSRAAVNKLLGSHTEAEIEQAIRGAVYFQGKDYKPQVMSFASLYEKWDSLIGHMQSVVKKGSDESNRFE